MFSAPGLVLAVAGAVVMLVAIQWASNGFAAAPVAKANVAALTAITLGIQLVFTPFPEPDRGVTFRDEAGLRGVSSHG